MKGELNVAKWVIALRSGKYKQTFGALRDSNGYCCLGVACQISGLGKWEKETTFGDDSREYVIGPRSRGSGILPVKVAKWLGLNSTTPIVTEGGCIATNANDLKRLSFGEIADGVEKLYLGGKKAEDIVKKYRSRKSDRRDNNG